MKDYDQLLPNKDIDHAADGDDDDDGVVLHNDSYASINDEKNEGQV